MNSKIHGIVRTVDQVGANAGTETPLAVDKVGRVITAPYQVRGLISTATASLTNGTAINLLAAQGAGVFADLLQVSCSNQSTAAANLTLLSDGTVMQTIQAPASSTIILPFAVAEPANTANTVWTADMEDITGTTVTVDALFVRNV